MSQSERRDEDGGYDDPPSWEVTYGSIEKQARLYRMERERFDAFRRIVKVTDEPSKRKLLIALVDNNNVATYADLDEYMTLSERNIRKHVNSLETSNVLQKDGNPASISFIDQETALLAQDVLAHMEW